MCIRDRLCIGFLLGSSQKKNIVYEKYTKGKYINYIFKYCYLWKGGGGTNGVLYENYISSITRLQKIFISLLSKVT